jgi:N-terminal acetyltransferase B complex catalytic subunit
MTTIRPFRAEDLFLFNHINLDPLTETYNIPFYMQYLASWPSLCASFEDPNGRMMGYILGKAEGEENLWHGHVTAVTVSPEFRRLGVAKSLMAYLEDVSQELYNGFFVDLFVRASNKLAQMMYSNLGYVIFRQVLGYYSGEETEDAFDMRKALNRDKSKKSMIPLTRPITPDELEW